jgi:teichoic acid transport system ATP-binding protein
MASNIAIKVENLTKIYRLYDKPQDRFKEALHPLRKLYHHDFYAINGISFEIKKGEAVGIIGKNGVGKSTLLKMITGVLTPTSGGVQVNGKIASLLELGAGFNSEMTGLENIYLNGILMGFSQQEINSKIEAILEFADIGEFIHQPVKVYSSGMFARLAFSVAINVEPEILIVDEALSVGDIAFQIKCFEKFKNFQMQGITILFVTHGLDSVIRYCDRGFVIDAGNIVFDGPPKFSVDAFKKVLSGDFYEKDIQEKSERKLKEPLKDSFLKHPEIDSYGNKKAVIIDYGILDYNNSPSAIINYNDDFQVVMKVKFFEVLHAPIFAYTLKDHKGLEITGTNTSMKHVQTGTHQDGDVISVVFKQKANLQLGKYILSLGCVNLNEDGIEVYNRIYDAILFEVIGANQMVGFFDLGSEISINGGEG